MEIVLHASWNVSSTRILEVATSRAVESGSSLWLPVRCVTRRPHEQEGGEHGGFKTTSKAGPFELEMLVQLGEVSSARQAFEGAALAPGDNATHR